MGWFSNTFTVNRANNTAELSAAGALLQGSKNAISGANQFVAQQKQRANSLCAKAFSVQGASSNLGCSLQRAINDLCDYERHSQVVEQYIDENMVLHERVVEQFSLPRGQRTLNMSGSEMAEGMFEVAGEMRQNIATLRNMHWDNVASAVTTIDNADLVLNPHSSTRARNSMPRLA